MICRADDNKKSVICPYLRLTAETKIAIPDGMSLGFKPPAFNSFLSDWDETYILLDFEFSVQAALGFISQSADGLIIFAVSKKISSSAEDDKEALPPWPPQAFREKGLT